SLIALFVSIAAIALGYGAAFTRSGTPQWAPWMLALGIPVAIGAIMILGAVRANRGIGALKYPFALVILILVIGFGAALALPSTDGPLSRLWLGLPARAAIVIYGVGLLPIIILPVASVSVSVSGFAFIGGPGLIYAVGLGAMYIVLPAAVTNVMGAWVLAKR